jgi:nucleoside-diphosphate-sugar epimerase
VIGDLDDSELLKREAAAADIVIHAADADCVPAARAIAEGLAAGHSDENPGFWIHVSGAGILTWYDRQQNRFGEAPLKEQEYRDIDRLLTLPEQADHRAVDEVVQAANSRSVRTAIVCPPTIYGHGRGPVNRESLQVPLLVQFSLENNFVPIASPGLAEWDHVHIHDLTAVFLKLAEATLDASKAANSEIFGKNGYYFVESGAHKWADVATRVARELRGQGVVPECPARQLPIELFAQPDEVLKYTWAANSKGISERAKQYLDWSPKGITLDEDISRVVRRVVEQAGKHTT